MSEAKQKPPMGRRMRILLFVSLAFNLVIVGLVVGMFAKGGPPPRDYHRSDPVLPFTRAFDDDQRKELGRELRRSFWQKEKKARGGWVESYQEALEVLREDPFDRARFDTVIANQKALAESRRGNGQEILSDYLEKLSPEERAAYADRLEEEISRLSKQRKHWRKDRD